MGRRRARTWSCCTASSSTRTRGISSPPVAAPASTCWRSTGAATATPSGSAPAATTTSPTTPPTWRRRARARRQGGARRPLDGPGGARPLRRHRAGDASRRSPGSTPSDRPTGAAERRPARYASWLADLDKTATRARPVLTLADAKARLRERFPRFPADMRGTWPCTARGPATAAASGSSIRCTRRRADAVLRARRPRRSARGSRAPSSTSRARRARLRLDADRRARPARRAARRARRAAGRRHTIPTWRRPSASPSC